MPVDISCEKYINSDVFCLPIEYCGWNIFEIENANEQLSVSPPNPFHVTILELHYYLGELKAFVGKLNEREHQYNQYWVGLCVRDSYLSEHENGKLIFDLTSNLGKFNAVISESIPKIVIDYEQPMVNWFRFDKGKIISGVSYLSEKEITINMIYEKIREVNPGAVQKGA
jgi:hypothetical protein